MSKPIVSPQDDSYAIETAGRYRASPVAIYLSHLKSQASKRLMETYLIRIVEIVRRQPFKSGARYLEHERKEAKAVVQAFPWHQIDYDLAMAIRAKLVTQYAPRTANGMIVALRRVLSYCYSQGTIDREQYERLIDKKNGLTQVEVDNSKLAGRELKDRELLMLKQVCLQDKNKPAGIRDAAMIGLCYVALLRRFELANLKLSDYDPETGNLTVLGKRNKTRAERANASVRELMADWLELRGDLPGPLFAPVNKGGKIDRERDGTPKDITPQAFFNMLKKRAQEAGIDPTSISPHDLRRTAITKHWRNGTPGPRIQKLAGHASIETTGRYDRSDIEEALEAAETLEF